MWNKIHCAIYRHSFNLGSPPPRRGRNLWSQQGPWVWLRKASDRLAQFDLGRHHPGSRPPGGPTAGHLQYRPAGCPQSGCGPDPRSHGPGHHDESLKRIEPMLDVVVLDERVAYEHWGYTISGQTAASATRAYPRTIFWPLPVGPAPAAGPGWWWPRQRERSRPATFPSPSWLTGAAFPPWTRPFPDRPERPGWWLRRFWWGWWPARPQIQVCTWLALLPI